MMARNGAQHRHWQSESTLRVAVCRCCLLNTNVTLRLPVAPSADYESADSESDLSASLALPVMPSAVVHNCVTQAAGDLRRVGGHSLAMTVPHVAPRDAAAGDAVAGRRICVTRAAGNFGPAALP